MNERIRKLAADARGQMVVLTTVDDEQWRQHEEFVEKFAELIVRECAQICQDQPNHYALKTDRDNCAVAIKEHFGVEE